MKNIAPAKKRGPQPTPIDMQLLTDLAAIQCTYEEIAAVMGLQKRQFINRVNEDSALKKAIENGWAKGRASVRRQQFKLLEAGNATMGVWLGKQLLGQRDNLDTKLTGSGAHGAVEVEISESPRDRILSRIAQMAAAGPKGESPSGPDEPGV